MKLKNLLLATLLTVVSLSILAFYSIVYAPKCVRSHVLVYEYGGFDSFYFDNTDNIKMPVHVPKFVDTNIICDEYDHASQDLQK